MVCVFTIARWVQQCRETAQARVSLLSRLREADAENRDTLEQVEDQWSTAVQDAAALIQSKEAQLQLVNDYCRQTQLAKTIMERQTAELDAVKMWVWSIWECNINLKDVWRDKDCGTLKYTSHLVQYVAKTQMPSTWCGDIFLSGPKSRAPPRRQSNYAPYREVWRRTEQYSGSCSSSIPSCARTWASLSEQQHRLRRRTYKRSGEAWRELWRGPFITQMSILTSQAAFSQRY